MNGKKMSNSRKHICSVTDLAKSLEMSRARFYQLQKEGIFPQSLYDVRTHRPFFDTKLQDICHEVRRTGIGFNGHYILFYSPRKNNPEKSSRRKNRSNSKYKELVETLCQMGLEVSEAQVEQAVETQYPNGIEGEDTGVVIRELFRFLKG